MSGLEAAGLIIAAVPICYEAVKSLKDTVDSFHNAGEEIDEMKLIVQHLLDKSLWQIEVIQQLWSRLKPSIQYNQERLLTALTGKLVKMNLRLKRYDEKPLTGSVFDKPADQLRRAKFAIKRTPLKESIDELTKFQDLFDPSWIMVLIQFSDSINSWPQQVAQVTQLMAQAHISTQDQARIQTQGSVEPLSQAEFQAKIKRIEGAQDFLDAKTPPPKKDIFLKPDVIDYATAIDIPYSTVKYVLRRREKPDQRDQWVLVDSRRCEPNSPVSIDIVTKDVAELARRFSTVPIEYGLPKCKGVIKVRNGDSRKPIGFDFVFEIPEELTVTPLSFPEYIQTGGQTLTERMLMAVQLASAVFYVHSIGFVHKNIRPETLLVLQKVEATKRTERVGGKEQEVEMKNNKFSNLVLTGFERFRKEDGRTMRNEDDDWRKNLYRHPHRQGEVVEHDYKMQHDIYSLGVCLLEIGLWKSFVEYKNGKPHTSDLLNLEKHPNMLKNSPELQRHLVAIATERLPQSMGAIYRDVVVNCLTCTDENNADFRDDASMLDEDEVEIGLRYIEKILTTLKEIKV